MEQGTAWRMIQTAFKCGRELQGLLQILKKELSVDEYKLFAVGIATAVDTINVQLIDRALKVHPELRAKIEADLANSGRIT
jgi:hypothetical protein